MTHKYCYFKNPSTISNYNAAIRGANAIGNAAKSAVNAVTKAGAGKVDDVVDTAISPVKKQGFLGKVLGGDTQEGIPKAGLLDKTLAFGTVASIPIGIGAMVMPNADTRAVQAMRAEDKAREAKGLGALAATPQMIAEKANEFKTGAANVTGGKVSLPETSMRLPGEFPPNSMRY